MRKKRIGLKLRRIVSLEEQGFGRLENQIFIKHISSRYNAGPLGRQARSAILQVQPLLAFQTCGYEEVMTRGEWAT